MRQIFLYIALSHKFSKFFTKVGPEHPSEKSLPTKTHTVNSPFKELSNALLYDDLSFGGNLSLIHI